MLRKEIMLAVLFLTIAGLSTCDSFDFYYFVRQWLGEYCHDDRCDNVRVHGFTIHGLWPNYSDGKYPQYCAVESNPFREYPIDDLLTELEDWWPSYENGNHADDTFWAHEWDKHGTCALPEFDYSENDYFNAVLNLHYMYNLTSAFASAGIVPSQDTRYDLEDLVDAMQDYFGKHAQVQCYGGYLYEVWQCFDLDLRLIDCPIVYQNCKEIQYEPFEDSPADIFEI